MRLILCISFTLLSILAYSECLSGSRSSIKALKYTSNQKVAGYGAGYSSQNSKESNKTLSKLSPNAKKSSGMSAWGIIAIILSIILSSIGGYYMFIFYPLLCKKERKYDVIELSPV